MQNCAGPTVWRLSVGLGVQFVALESLKDFLLYRRPQAGPIKDTPGGSRPLSKSILTSLAEGMKETAHSSVVHLHGDQCAGGLHTHAGVNS